MPEQPRVEDFQRERQVALTGEGDSGADEWFGLSPGQQVKRLGFFFLAPRVKPLSVWLPVAGALVIQPGDEVVTGDQVRHDRGGVVPQRGGQITKVQDVGQRQVLADPGQRELVQAR